MQIFNLGLGEVIFILLIAVVVLGPQRIVTFSRRAGQWLRGMVQNPVWREVIATSRELRDIPNQLMKETGLQAEVEILNADVIKVSSDMADDWQKVEKDLPLFPSQVEPTGE